MKVEEREVDGFKLRQIILSDMMLGIATDIGPRILYLASSKRPDFNLLGVLPKSGAQTPAGFWRVFGGHRLWGSPEATPRSYSMDDKPVKIEIRKDGATVHGNPEVENSIQKEVTVKTLSEDSIQVIHRIRNIGRWPIKTGCWAISIMRKNGFAIVPIKPSKVDKEGLLPDRHITIWPYTSLSDPRINYTSRYIFIKQNSEFKNLIKIGTMANPSWVGYWVDGMAFVKQFTQQDGEYPDFGCSAEVYTNAEMLELETLGPLKTANPSEYIEHKEVWRILEIKELQQKPESIDEKLESLLAKMDNSHSRA